MPMSKTRTEFYTQRYFPVYYYNELYQQTLEEAKDNLEAQKELDKLLIDAQREVRSLYAEVRPGRFTPQATKEVLQAQQILEEWGKSQESSNKFVSGMRTNPVATSGLSREIEAALTPVGVTSPTASSKAQAAAKAIEQQAAKYAQSNPDLAKKILVEGVAYATKQGIDFGASPASLNNAIQRVAGAGQDLASITARVNSAEGRTGVSSFTSGVAEPPQVQEARRIVDASQSPFANGVLEEPGHIASGLNEEEDDLLRLYLSRLKDEDSPGVVTREEFEEANPGKDFDEAERIYQDVATGGRYLKTSAEWFNDSYLDAVRTKDMLEKKQQTLKDEMQGLSPQEWAARRAYERGGYTAEDIHYLAALRDYPDKAELIRPAYARAREGLEPKTELEKVIAAAFESDPDITLDSLEAEISRKQRQIRQATRAGIRTGAVVDKPGARKEGREAAREISVSDEDALRAAKAYLVALRLPPNQVAEGIVAPPPAEKPKTPVEAAEETVAATKSEASKPPAPTEPPTTPTEEEDFTLGDGVIPVEEAEEGPTDQDFVDRMASPPPAGPPREEPYQVDPTNPDYSYKLMPNGSYAYAYKGIPRGFARPGTQEFKSITSVLGGGQPLPTKSAGPKAPATSTSATSTKPQATPEAFRAKAETETDPTKKKALLDAADRMERAAAKAPPGAPEPSPAPTPTPAPVAPPAPVTAPADPFARLPGESAADYAKRLEEME